MTIYFCYCMTVSLLLRNLVNSSANRVISEHDLILDMLSRKTCRATKRALHTVDKLIS